MSIQEAKYTVVDRLAVEIHPSREALGRAAAASIARYLQAAIRSQGFARVVFGCAPSQDETLAALANPSLCGAEVDWSRVTAFHMDDYVGLSAADAQSFRRYLAEHLLKKVGVGSFHPIEGEAADPARVCSEYERLLLEKPIDLVCMGIGENGHIAFNDPPVADFEDSRLVKVVEMDELCRRQQVNDGCFPSLEAVPRRAFTLTVPVFRNARRLSVHVPGPRKAKAVRDALLGPIASSCPASILRLHPEATLYLDPEAAALVWS